MDIVNILEARGIEKKKKVVTFNFKDLKTVLVVDDDLVRAAKTWDKEEMLRYMESFKEKCQGIINNSKGIAQLVKQSFNDLNRIMKHNPKKNNGIVKNIREG